MTDVDYIVAAGACILCMIRCLEYIKWNWARTYWLLPAIGFLLTTCECVEQIL